MIHIWVVGGEAMAQFEPDRTYTAHELERVVAKMRTASKSRLVWLETGFPKGLPT